ncbi:MAG: DUF1801 domain-containing protein [Nonomuraea sp.]|nr:DUF1801 domain-containing protein [Nonomuraea sp.]
MSATKRTETEKSYDGFSEEERSAMKERSKELKATSRSRSRSAAKAADGEGEVLAKLAEMTDADRATGERIHAIVKAAAPALTPRLYYGMPAYARDGKIVCFFQPAQKFKTRYSTLGFNDAAQLDDGTMWPSAYALTTLSAEDETRIAELVKRAAG